MERKIGEIFEYNGEWYQCIIGHCNQCSFDKVGTCKFIGNPYCAYRNDKKLVCFKKLEKVGEPTMLDGKLVQKILTTDSCSCNGCCFESPKCDKADNDLCCGYEIYVEIKPTKEDKVEEFNVMEEKKLNLKPFDIQKAREGKPVCTRDGRKVRIICYDLKNDKYPIVAAVGNDSSETLFFYTTNGEIADGIESDKDLMMLPEKKEGWVNVYNADTTFYFVEGMVYDTKEEAIKHINPDNEIYTTTVKIEWEE